MGQNFISTEEVRESQAPKLKRPLYSNMKSSQTNGAQGRKAQALTTGISTVNRFSNKVVKYNTIVVPEKT